jgi:hypothetical protein
MTATGAPRRPVVRTTVRATLSATAVVVLYYLLPLDRPFSARTVVELVGGLVLIAGLVAWQIRSILRAEYPALRALDWLAFTVPLFLVLFAATYVVLDHSDLHAFSGAALTRTDALYFVVTVFATVGFGDITPVSEVARVLATVQMICDLLVLGLAVRAVATAVRHSGMHGPSARRRGDDATGGDGGGA